MVQGSTRGVVLGGSVRYGGTSVAQLDKSWFSMEIYMYPTVFGAKWFTLLGEVTWFPTESRQ